MEDTEKVWIIPKRSENDGRPYCSVCNARVPFSKDTLTFLNVGLNGHSLFGELAGYMKFCFNCGAKMEGTKFQK